MSASSVPGASAAPESLLDTSSSSSATAAPFSSSDAPLPTLPNEILALVFLAATPPIFMGRSSFLRDVVLLSSTWADWTRHELMRDVVLPDRATAVLWLASKELKLAGSGGYFTRSKREGAGARQDLASAMKACDEVEVVKIFGPFDEVLRVGDLPWGTSLRALEMDLSDYPSNGTLSFETPPLSPPSLTSTTFLSPAWKSTIPPPNPSSPPKHSSSFALSTSSTSVSYAMSRTPPPLPSSTPSQPSLPNSPRSASTQATQIWLKLSRTLPRLKLSTCARGRISGPTLHSSTISLALHF